MLELAILGLLQEQPRHGYELKKRLSETLGSFWGISFGSLYPALRRLERSGAIEVVDAREADVAVPAMPATGSLKGEAAAARLRLVPAPAGAAPARRTGSPRSARSSSSPCSTADDGGDDERLVLAQARVLPLPRSPTPASRSSSAGAPSWPTAWRRARRARGPGRRPLHPLASWTTARAPPSATSSGSTI